MRVLQLRSSKGVILCADDFGLNQSASMGIAKLAEMGRLSATSSMVLSPRWPQDAALLYDLRERLDVGLHLDWTSAFAVAAGHGMSLARAMRTAVLGGFDPARAASVTRVVIERQLDAFERHWKAPPDHVDGHQHVQQFAGIRDALVQIMALRYGTQAYLRISRPAPGRPDAKSWVIAAMGAAALNEIATDAGLPVAASLSGVYDFAGNQLWYANLMEGWLRDAPSGAIIMCHPAQAAEPDDRIGVARAQEFNYLCGPEFGAALTRHGVRLMRGDSL
jgi:predicted glycoside hydrolase/deacetylase ChbG (UPF0249 family)